MNLSRSAVSVLVSITLVSLMIFSDAAVAAPNTAAKRRPKIAIVLEGGGARGFAHVGVIKALEESRIPVDMVTGTSMGSIVGAAYSAGRSVEEMERVLTGTDWDKLFDEQPPRSDLAYRLKAGREREIFGEAKISVNDAGLVTPGGVIDGINILPLLQQLVGDVSNPADFDHLPLRFRAVAADIATGEAVVFSKGDLARAMRASMSVPFLFTPVEIDGRLLVDGGVVDNLPVDQALAMGADIIIAIELTEEFKPKEQLRSPFAVSNQMLSFLLEDNTVQAKKLLRSGDRLVRVDLPGYGSGDFNKGKEILALGYEAGKKAVEALKDLSLSEPDYAAYKAQLRREPPDQKIDFIEVNNSSGLPDEIITQQLSFKVGDKIDREQISSDLIRIYNTGQFATIDYDYIQRDGKQGVLITVSGKEWYKQFGRFGASFEDDFQGNARYRLAVNYRKADLNPLGGYLDFEGEVGNYPRAKVEFFQPVDNGSPYFIAPIFVVRKTPILLRNSRDVLAEYERFDLAGEFTAGRELGSYGELRFGYIRGFGDLERRVGDPILPNIDYDTGEVYSRLVIDTVDAPDFPTEGVASSIGYNRAIEDLGSSDEYDDLSGSFSKPFTFGRNTLLFNGDFGLSLGDRPVERSYSLGGFLNLSGYAKSSLLASDYAIGRMMLYRRIEEIKLPFMGVGFFGGGTLEIGTLTSDIDNVLDPGTIISSALFVGADTPIVPVYFGIGMSEGGEVSGYMALGRVGVVRQ